MAAPFRQCLRMRHLPKARQQLPLRTARNARTYATGPRPDSRNPGRPTPIHVWAPKTRIAVGILFCGTLIYSMVDLPTPLNSPPTATAQPSNILLGYRDNHTSTVESIRRTYHCRTRCPHQARVGRDQKLAHAIAHGGVYQAAAEGDCRRAGED